MTASSSSAKSASAPDSFFTATLAEADPEIAAAIKGELGRQRHEIELIASENIVSRAVLEAQGSVLTNKYAEGYPGNRYYGGCEWVDVVETLAIERAKKLFGAQFANVQPNSGSQMNQAEFLALLQPGDTFMGLDLAAGGHLTHGAPVNISGKWFKAQHYTGRRDDQIIDMDEVARLMHVIAAKAVAFGEALRPDFKVYAKNVVENAKALAESLRANGLDIVSSGTDNHLMLVDLRPKGLKGNASEKALVRAAITCNKNGIPFDPETPFVTSGLRLGTPAATTRGFGVAEFKQVAGMIAEVLNAIAQSQDSKAIIDRKSTRLNSSHANISYAV